MATKDKRRGQTRVEKVLSAERRRPSDARWYRASEKDCHTVLFSQLDRLHRLTNWRRTQDLYCACLYDDAEFASLVQGSQAIGEFTPQTMTTNIVKRQVDTFVQRITEGKPIPMAITSGGTYSEQRRAKALSKIFDGVLDQVGYWDTRPLLRRDGALFGDGFALNHRVGSQLVHDRAFPWEFYVDPREARYGKPQTLVLLRYVDKLVMAERHPEHAEAIFNSVGKSSWQHHWDTGWDETCDLVLVAWAWRLPSAEATDKDAKSGAFAMCVSDATIELADYRRDYFPISKWRFNPALVGWRGEGMAWGLRGLQYEVNAIGLRMQEQAFMAGSYVWTPPDSGLETEMIDNGVFTHLISTQKPEFFNAPPWHPGIFDYYLNLRGRFPAEESRLSEMASRGELPPGLESGKAIRTWNQLDDKAFALQTKEDERDAIDTSWQFFDLLEEITNDPKLDEPVTVQVEKRQYGSSVLEEYKFEDYRLDRKKFTLKVYPTSMLKGTPAEQYQTAREWMQDGLVSQDEVYALFDIPDVQRILNLRGAARRAIEKILEKILDADDPQSAYVHPEPAMNLELCRALALMTYLDAWTNEAEPENLKWVLQFALDAELELQAADNEAAAAQGAVSNAAVDPSLAVPSMVDPALADPMMGSGPPMGGPPPDATFAPPPEQPMPTGAVAPDAMAPIPGM